MTWTWWQWAIIGALLAVILAGVYRVNTTITLMVAARRVCLYAGYTDMRSVGGGLSAEYFCTRRENGTDVVVPVTQVRP